MSIEIFIKMVQILGVDANELLGVSGQTKEDGQCRKMFCRIRHLKQSEQPIWMSLAALPLEVLLQNPAHPQFVSIPAMSAYIAAFLPEPEQFFENREWYLRLVLEGEDRLNRNHEEKERSWNVSYRKHCEIFFHLIKHIAALISGYFRIQAKPFLCDCRSGCP